MLKINHYFEYLSPPRNEDDIFITSAEDSMNLLSRSASTRSKLKLKNNDYEDSYRPRIEAFKNMHRSNERLNAKLRNSVESLPAGIKGANSFISINSYKKFGNRKSLEKLNNLTVKNSRVKQKDISIKLKQNLAEINKRYQLNNESSTTLLNRKSQ